MFVSNNYKSPKITELCSRDTVVTEVHLQTSGDHISTTVFLTSMYLLYDSTKAPPSLELGGIVEFGSKRRRHLLLKCEANAHHTL